MVDDSSLDKFKKILDAIHCTVVRIENEHGAKIDVLFEGQESLRTDVADLKAGQESLKTDVADLKAGQEILRTDVAGLKAGQEILRTDVAGLKAGQESLRADLAGLKVGQREIRGEVREVKSSVGLLHTIANQHESRLQKVEGSLSDHLTDNS
jgi:chromosome segregation ATPase